MGLTFRSTVDPQRRPRRVHLFDRDALETLGQRAAEDIRQAAERGEGIGGQRLGTYAGGKQAGRKITLRRTGALLDGMAVRATRRRVVVGPTVRYARHVLRRFPQVMSLDPDKAHRRAADLIDERLR